MMLIIFIFTLIVFGYIIGKERRHHSRKKKIIDSWWKEIERLEEQVKLERLADENSTQYHFLAGREISLLHCIEKIEEEF